MKYKDVMIDIETLGLQHGACIIQIAAVTFNPFMDPRSKYNDAEQHFIHNIDVTSQLMYDGGHIDERTVVWWRDASYAARATLGHNVLKIELVLSKFNDWIQRISKDHELRVWAHGPTFDVSRLEWWYNKVGYDVPWHYRAPRDTRTLYDIAKSKGWEEPERPKEGTAEHYALDDAIWQAACVQSAHIWLNKGK